MGKKTLIVIQSIDSALDYLKKQQKQWLPELNEQVIYDTNFENCLELIPKNGKIIVIASNIFHDKENKKFERFAKNGGKLAEEIKKINPNSKVYIYSTDAPHNRKYIDGFFKKNCVGDTREEIRDMLTQIGLISPPKKNFFHKIFKLK